MNDLIETCQRLLNSLSPYYQRDFYSEFKLTHRLMGLVGQRGVGKTTFLLHYLKTQYARELKQTLYVSADHLYFSENTLLGLVDKFHKEYAGKIICIDEIHRYQNWNQELKNIYDSYPELKIIFSGSSSLDLVKSKYDLSRRALLKVLNGFSFREYLEYKLDKKFPKLTLKNILSNEYDAQMAKEPRLIGHLKDYFQCGYYPMWKEFNQTADFFESLLNIIDKTIYEDISSYYNVKTQSLDVFRKLLYFVATTEPGELGINKLAKSLKKDHTTISEYLEMLRDTKLLRFLTNNQKGHALVRNAEKLYSHNTNMIYAINQAIGHEPGIGSVREVFFASHLQDAGYKITHAKKGGDVCCDGFTFEICGKSKSNTQIKNIKNSYLVKDDILYATTNQIPLYLFGFLY